MKMKVVETSLNLRIERGYDRMDYTLTKEVAEKQLSLCSNVYANVEFMECNNTSYIETFREAGYNIYTAVDGQRRRGILYAVQNEYEVKEIASMQEPHMLHIRISKGCKYIDFITVRLLIAGGNDADFIDRNKQWNKVMNYVDGLEDKKHLVMTGDWNHGVIAEFYLNNQPRRYFNYQMIAKSLLEKNIELFEIDGFSYKGYMKPDHIASGAGIKILKAEYKDAFGEVSAIGIPDHKLIIAELDCA